ncbi:MAG: RNA 2',3'-cyclic phosphodiesterase [Chloroflexota bacterium]
MTVIRAFVAINVSSEIQSRLDKVIGDLRKKMPDGAVRWVLASNLHLTLKFLGDVSVANLKVLQEVLQNEISHHRAVEISVGGLGAFPSSRRARVIWSGVEAPPELGAIQAGIENELARLGYAREERAFSPHLTLGRVSRNASQEEIRQIGDVLCNTKVGFLGAAAVDAVHLYQSDLRPEGSMYTCLFSAPLRAA